MSEDRSRYVKKKIKHNKAVKDNMDALNDERNKFGAQVKKGAEDIGNSLVPKGGGKTASGDDRYNRMLKNMDDKYQNKLSKMSNQFDALSNYTQQTLGDTRKGMSQLEKSNAMLRKQVGEGQESTKKALTAMQKYIQGVGKKSSGEGSPTTGGRGGPADPLASGGYTTPISKTLISKEPKVEEVEENKVENKEEESTETTTTPKTTTTVTTPKTTTTVTTPENKNISYTTPNTWVPTEGKPFDDKNLTIGKQYTVGEFSLRPTNLFGYRSGKNSVGGRSSKSLSNGIDYVETNGNAVALDDGEVVRVHAQGNPYVRHPGTIEKNNEKTAPSGGWIVTIKNKKTGLYTTYMHMDAFSSQDVTDLVGKEFKRGDKFWTAKVGSGTQTGPHVKVTQYMNPGNYKEERGIYNPSKFISGGV